jgi:hypothetical protein
MFSAMAGAAVNRGRLSPAASRWLWLAFYAALIACKLFLSFGQPRTVYPAAAHDDTLFLHLAESIADGRWLGGYSEFTLMKGSFFSIFMAASHLLGLPISFSRDLLYLAACGLTVVAFAPAVPGRWQQALIFSLLLFNPASTAIDRILREEIYPSLTLLVVAFAIGLWLRVGMPPRRLAVWAAGLGLSLGAFWLTREEGLWILPILAFIYLASAVRYRTGSLRWREYVLVFSIPLAIWAASLATVATLNLVYYGTFCTVEAKEKNFVAAYGALARIRHDKWYPTTPVPRETRQRAYRVSPAFAELRPYIDGEMGKLYGVAGNGGWTSLFTGSSYHPVLRNLFNSYFEVEFPQNGVEAWSFLLEQYRINPDFAEKLDAVNGGKLLTREWLDPSESEEIRAGWFIWALRNAASLAGHYTSGAEASAYFGRIAAEINAACAAGSLDCLPERNTLAPVWDAAYLAPLLDRLTSGARFFSSMVGLSVFPTTSGGPPQTLADAAQFVRENVLPPQYRIDGWMWSPEGPVSFDVVDRAGRSWLGESARGQPSDDVYRHFMELGINSSDAKTSRFSLTTPCIWGCILVMRAGNRELARTALNGQIFSIDRNDIRVGIGSFEIERATLREGARKWRNLLILDFIYRAYQASMPWLCCISLVGVAVLSRDAFVNRDSRRIWLIAMVLLALIAGRLSLLSLISVSSFPAVHALYLSSLFPLMILFVAIILGHLSNGAIWRRILRKPTWAQTR